jgi:hypothetical protein
MLPRGDTVWFIALAFADPTTTPLPLPGHDPRLAGLRTSAKALTLGGLATAGVGIAFTFGPLLVPITCPAMEGISCGPPAASSLGLGLVGGGALGLAAGLALQAHVDRREKRLPPSILPIASSDGAGLVVVFDLDRATPRARAR